MLIPLLALALQFSVPSHGGAVASGGGTPAGCGVGTDNSQCAATAPFPSAPTSPTSVSACGGTLSANTKYQLTANIGSTASATCLTLGGGGIVLDLNGHTLTGRIVGSGIAVTGHHIYSSQASGVLTCSDASATNPGCLAINGDGTTTIAAVNEFDHFTCNNTSNSNSNSERCLMVDVGGVLTSVVGPNIKVHHMGGTSATGTSSSRIVNAQIQGTANTTQAYAEFYNNSFTCQSLAAACQGQVAYGLYDVKMHNNNLTNQLADASLTETPRAMLCDQTNGCEMYYNIVACQDGRCARFRGTTNINDVNSLHDNQFNSIVAGTNPNYVGALHLGDPDCPTPCQETENLTVSNNTFNVTTGAAQEFMHGVMVRNATAINFSGNAVSYTGPIDSFYSMRIQSSGSDTGNVFNTTITGGGSLASTCDAGASNLFCKSGTVSGGSCTVNNSAC